MPGSSGTTSRSNGSANSNPLAIILSGGPASVYEAGAPRCDPRLFDMGIPVLAICYGMQLVCEALGGKVEPAPAREYGRAECHVIDPTDPLFENVPASSTVWMSHGDQVHATGDAFTPVAATATCPLAAVRHRTLPVYGLQFHPEVAHSPHGATILGNFLDKVCRSPGAWTMDAFIDRAVDSIAAQVGPDERVVCGLSGGVDSAVCAALLARALGSRVVCVFVDNGLLRGGERAAVADAFGRHSDAELIVVDAEPSDSWKRSRESSTPRRSGSRSAIRSSTFFATRRSRSRGRPSSRRERSTPT